MYLSVIKSGQPPQGDSFIAMKGNSCWCCLFFPLQSETHWDVVLIPTRGPITVCWFCKLPLLAFMCLSA